MPARPASAPDSAKAKVVIRRLEKPAKVPARGDWPSTRISKPFSVERITTASDKRKRLLVVTDKGKALYEQVKTVADDLREEILTAITPQEQEQTQRVLEKLLREVEKK